MCVSKAQFRSMVSILSKVKPDVKCDTDQNSAIENYNFLWEIVFKFTLTRIPMNTITRKLFLFYVEYHWNRCGILQCSAYALSVKCLLTIVANRFSKEKETTIEYYVNSSHSIVSIFRMNMNTNTHTKRQKMKADKVLAMSGICEASMLINLVWASNCVNKMSCDCRQTNGASQASICYAVE